jgi:hypothetical protein
VLGVVVAVGLMAATTTPSAAQEPPPPSATAPTGYAEASAYAVRLAPSIGGTALTFTFGGTGSFVQNAFSNGISAAIDLGLIQTIFGTGVCGIQGFDTSFIPAPTLITNAEGDRTVRTQIAGDGSLLGVGHQVVSVTKEPMVDASLELAAVGLAPLLTVGGLHASAVAENAGGATPTAHASAVTDIDLPGILTLRGLHWEATQSAGSSPEGAGSFTFGEGTLLGMPLPPGDFSAAVGPINQALNPLGISLSAPEVVQETSGATYLTRVSPLAITYKTSKQVLQLLAPFFEIIRSSKEQIVDAVASTCFASYGALIADLVLGIAVGTGEVALLVGGANAQANSEALTNPFATTDAPLAGDPALGPALAGINGSAPAADLPATGVTVPTGSSDLAGGLFDVVCRSANPRGADHCGDGRGTLAGGVVLAATAAVIALDLRRRRRRPGPAVDR